MHKFLPKQAFSDESPAYLDFDMWLQNSVITEPKKIKLRRPRQFVVLVKHFLGRDSGIYFTLTPTSTF